MSAEIDRLRALHAAATPGEWTLHERTVALGDTGDYDGWLEVRIGDARIGITSEGDDDEADRNLRSCVESHNALPALLDEIERLRGLVRSAHERLELLVPGRDSCECEICREEP